jgi:hypothetical protein
VLSIDPVPVFVHYALAELFLGSHLAQLQASGTLSPGQARQWWGVSATRGQVRDAADQLHSLHHRRRHKELNVDNLKSDGPFKRTMCPSG